MALIIGSPLDDTRDGTEHADRMSGKAGNDILDGKDGNDKIYGDVGNDLLFGNNGSDDLYGGKGIDVLYGGDGSDLLYGGKGNDALEGGAGSDTLYGGAGDDSLVGTSSVGATHDRLYGGSGNDVVSLTLGNFGYADGGNGMDTLFYGIGDQTSSVTFNAAGGSARDGHHSSSFTGFEAYSVNCNDGDDLVRTAGGTDSVYLEGGAADVKTFGGKDFVSFTTGSTVNINGGGGYDDIEIQVSGHAKTVFRVEGNHAVNSFDATLLNFETFTYYGGSGTDKVHGGKHRDVLEGAAGHDNLHGAGGNDVLNGGGGKDHLFGGAGNDVLYSSKGQDILNGGSGHDEFVFYEAKDFGSRVVDFHSGIDSLHLAVDLLGGAYTAGDSVALHANPQGHDAQLLLRYDSHSDTTRLVLDSNGTQTGGRAIVCELDGHIHLLGSDIQLDDYFGF